ncbi:Putative peptidoglycan binding domain protein [Stieleria maiorica]|uniref:Peptidoglycan binding domain protein n=1 Tax=Stieleria maiorica TaxID=2795974 RepID=A0A5B9M799_9BACT|nr:peptidoglycan-binding domain-containing protein [Stieleria maiorica]QEF97078.1 Putative peptidoglycan binding domain protein [Stieleria maiorica]
MKILANTGRACVEDRFESGVSTWKISASVGQGGRNHRDDVRTIQRLLNLIDPQDGGPVVALEEDGWIGPKTNKAILDFQRFQGTGSDGRVDPHGPTLKRMNEIPKHRMKAQNATLLARVAAAMPDLNQMSLKARRTIEGAIDYVRLGDGLFTSKRDYELADLYFDFSKLSSTQTLRKLDTIRTTLRRAYAALQVPPIPLTGSNPVGISIFTIDPLGKNHFAYVPRTEAKTKDRGPGSDPAYIYLCQKMGKPKMDKFTHILMHELFHFIDDETFLYIRDHCYRDRIFSIPHEKRMRNADNYAVFTSHVHFGRARLVKSQPKLGPHIPPHL